VTTNLLLRIDIPQGCTDLQDCSFSYPQSKASELQCDQTGSGLS
jgi:hypothetical protein